jgi:hypothetical protein
VFRAFVAVALLGLVGLVPARAEEQFVVRCGRASVHMAAVWLGQGETALHAEAAGMIDELLWRAARLGLIEPTTAAMRAGYGYGNDDIAQRIYEDCKRDMMAEAKGQ